MREHQPGALIPTLRERERSVKHSVTLIGQPMALAAVFGERPFNGTEIYVLIAAPLLFLAVVLAMVAVARHYAYQDDDGYRGTAAEARDRANLAAWRERERQRAA